MKALLIAEKASLRDTIQAVYEAHKDEIDYSITFLEQSGHLLTLKQPDEIDEALKEWSWDTLPIHPEEHGGWKYKIAPKSKKQNIAPKTRYIKIKQELSSGKYDFVINAGDPDQEGQLLIRIVLASLKNKLPVKRYWSTATTEGHVLRALQNLKDDDHDPMLVNLLQAAYGRQHSDYRFGMNISRAATLQMHGNVSCGRVKTVMLAIVCKREIEIANFKPSTSYGVKVKYIDGFWGQYYIEKDMKDEEGNDDADDAEELEENEENEGYVYFDTAEEAKAFILGLKPPAIVKKYEKKKVKTSPPKLFKLATAQVAAGKLGYSPKETLSILQSLYEKGYMSYPRTDSEYVASEEDLETMLKSAYSVPELRSFIDNISAVDIRNVKKKKKWVNDKKMAESGHTALVPTTDKPDFSELSSDEKIIYTLICRRFVSIFLPPLIQNKVVLETDIGGNTFRTTGKTLIQPGYTEIYDQKFNDVELPEYEVGQRIKMEGFKMSKKMKTCPKRFTEDDLIAVCENPHKYLDDKRLKELGKRLKIGTPATRADILEELIYKLKYLQMKKDKKKSYIVPSELGMMIWKNIKDCKITRVDMTGEWEESLEEVRTGRKSLSQLEKEMINDVNQMVEDIKNTEMHEIESLNKRKVIGKCPKCGEDYISSNKSFYCSNYKGGCKFGAFRKIWDSTLTDEEFKTMVAGKHLAKEIKKDKKKWVAELKYNFEDCKVEFVIEEKVPSQYKCPKCGKQLQENSKVISCDKECGFRFGKSLGEIRLLNEQIRLFFEQGDTGRIKNVLSKKGNRYECNLVLNKDKTGAEIKLPERKSEKTKYKCPKCKAGIIKSGLLYTCQNQCGFKLYASLSGGVLLKDEQIENFFIKGTTGLVRGIQGKTRKFNAQIVLNADKSGTEFKYPKRKR